MNSPYIIGITGGSASGKTLFIKELKACFGDYICILSQDDYYKTIDQQPRDQNGKPNFDTPLSIDIPLFLSDLKLLKEGNPIQKQEYTFNNPMATPGILTINPAPVIIVEGIFVFYYPEILNLLDFKIFLEAKEFIRIKRRIVRDKIERGYDMEEVLYQYENHVGPTYDSYIAPFKDEADIIIPNNRHFGNALAMVKAFISTKYEV